MSKKIYLFTLSGISVFLSFFIASCQLEYNADFLQASASAPSQNATSYIDSSRSSEVAFSSIDIPEVFLATEAESTLETVGIEVELESGERYYGVVRIGVLLDGDIDKISSFEISSELLNALGLETSYWMDAHLDDINPVYQARITGLKDCLEYCEASSDRPKLCKAGCWAGTGLKIAKIVRDTFKKNE